MIFPPQTIPSSFWRSSSSSSSRRICRSLCLVVFGFTLSFGLFGFFETFDAAAALGGIPTRVEKRLHETLTAVYYVEPSNNSKLFLEDGNHLPLEDDMTVVTAFFNLGSFQKGPGSIFKVDLYRGWMKIFSRIRNHLIVYVDDEVDLKLFTQLRSNFPPNRTLIINTTRSILWSFSLVPNISDIYKQPGYPKHHPNTVLPEYSSAMHAKYDLMQISIERNPFQHKYFCWLDIGYFRDIVNQPNGTDFYLYLPPAFNEDSVAYNEVSPRVDKLSSKDIVYGNQVWLGGGFFLARWDVMLKLVGEYKSWVERLIGERLMSTDQQVIYSAVNRGTLRTKLQSYIPPNRASDWFYLGYLAKAAGRNRTSIL